jgi:hypothetical protein
MITAKIHDNWQKENTNHEGKFFLICDYEKTALSLPNPHFASQLSRRLRCGFSSTTAKPSPQVIAFALPPIPL